MGPVDAEGLEGLNPVDVTSPVDVEGLNPVDAEGLGLSILTIPSP